MWLILAIAMYFIDKKDKFFYRNRVLVEEKPKDINNLVEVHDIAESGSEIQGNEYVVFGRKTVGSI